MAGALGQVQGFVELILPSAALPLWGEFILNQERFPQLEVGLWVKTSFVKVTLLVAFCNYDV